MTEVQLEAVLSELSKLGQKLDNVTNEGEECQAKYLEGKIPVQVFPKIMTFTDVQ